MSQARRNDVFSQMSLSVSYSLPFILKRNSLIYRLSTFPNPVNRLLYQIQHRIPTVLRLFQASYGHNRPQHGIYHQENAWRLTFLFAHRPVFRGISGESGFNSRCHATCIHPCPDFGAMRSKSPCQAHAQSTTASIRIRGRS